MSKKTAGFFSSCPGRHRFPRFGKVPKALALAASLFVLFSGPIGAQEAPRKAGPTAPGEAELAVTKVILYTSGLAYVEHQGSVEGDSVVSLSFKPEQINDVLKSLILLDQGGGRVETVNFTSQDPLTRALQSFAVDLSAKPGLGQILDQMRGAEVQVSAPQAIRGKIVGLENQTRPVPGSSGQVYQELYLNLLTSEGLRALPLSSVSLIKPVDERLSQELQKALDLLLGAADSQRKTVDIRFTGKGKRPVLLAYVTEAPVWKTSYRLDLGSSQAPGAQKSGSATASGNAYLQAWAIVENVSDRDWRNVSLSLVSGSPLAFVQDLYTPLYRERPVVENSVQGSIGPQTYDGGMPSATASAPRSAPAPMARESTSALAKGASAYAEYGGDERSLSGGGVVSSAQGEKFGELFFFNLRNPVSLPRRSGAMIPLLGEQVKSEKLSIYNASVLAKNPLNGAKITNTSGLRLPAGPLTVFDGSNYAGDALLDSLGPGEDRLLSYAVDLDAQIDSTLSSEQDIRRFSLSQGLLVIQRQTRYLQSYKILNRGKADKTLILEHPKIQGRALIDTQAPEEETASVYRFLLSLKPGETRTFTVKEQTVYQESLSLLSTQARTYLSYTTNGAMSPAVKASLEKAAQLRAELDRKQAVLNEASQSRSQIEKDQARLRDNLDAVGRDNAQGQRYLEKLMESEVQLEDLDRKIASLKIDQQKAQADFDAYVRSLNVE